MKSFLISILIIGIIIVSGCVQEELPDEIPNETIESVYDIFDHMSEVDLLEQQIYSPFAFNTWPNYNGKSITILGGYCEGPMCYSFNNPKIGIIDEPEDVDIEILKVYTGEMQNLKDLEDFNSPRWKNVEKINDNLYTAQGRVELILFEVKTGNFTGERDVLFGFKTDNLTKYALINIEISDNLITSPEEIPDEYELFVHGIQYELEGIPHSAAKNDLLFIEGEGYFHQGHPLIKRYLNNWVFDGDYEQILRTISKEVDSLLDGPAKINDVERKYVPFDKWMQAPSFVPDFYHLKDAEINEKSHGVCTQKAMLFVSFARALGFPARSLNIRAEPEGHMVAEVWIPNKGWTFVDPLWQFFGVEEDMRNYDTLILWSGMQQIANPEEVEGYPGVYEMKAISLFPFMEERDYPKYSKKGCLWSYMGIQMNETVIEGIEITWAGISAPSTLKIKLTDGSYFEKQLPIVAGQAQIFDVTEGDIAVSGGDISAQGQPISITSQGETYLCSKK